MAAGMGHCCYPAARSLRRLAQPAGVSPPPRGETETQSAEISHHARA
jgi:hypothetical protein